jgi:hypothetical protein
VVRVRRRVCQRLLPEAYSRAMREAYYLQRTRFESIAERKLRRRQLTEDGNVEISGRDVRGVSGVPTAEDRLKSTLSGGSLRVTATGKKCPFRQCTAVAPLSPKGLLIPSIAVTPPRLRPPERTVGETGALNPG